MAIKINLEMSDKFSFPVKGTQQEVDVTQITSQVSHRRIYEYGLRKLVADAASGDTEEKHGKDWKDKVAESCGKRIADLYAGVKGRGTGSRAFAGLDAAQTALYQAAFRKVDNAFRTAGIKFAWKDFRAEFSKATTDEARVALMNEALGMRIAAYKGKATKARAQAIIQKVMAQAAEQVKKDQAAEDELFGL